MIYFLCLRRNAVPIRTYLRAIWPAEHGARIERVHYDELVEWAAMNLRAGLYVFADTELLDDVERSAAVGLHTRLKAEPGRFRVWNHPGRSARRLEVLETLAKDGVNDFRAFRAGGALPADLRYPVFLRDEHEHAGPLTPLLRDAEEVAAALAGLRSGARKDGPLLVVEFLNYVGTDGIYRKYSVFRFGDFFVRKHVLFAEDWVLKTPDTERFKAAKWLEEEQAYLCGADGRADTEVIFERFGIDYGRIDYAVVEKRIQVFEINTNPTLLKPENLAPCTRLEAHRFFAARAAEAWAIADPEARPRMASRLRWLLHKPKLNPASWWGRWLRSPSEGNGKTATGPIF